MTGNELFSLDTFIFNLLSGDATLQSYLPSVNEVVSVNVGTSTGGTFTLTQNGLTTGAIAYNASAATVQTACNAAWGAGAVGVTGSGTTGTPWIITFSGSAVSFRPIAVTGDGSLLTGGTLTLSEPAKGVSCIFGEAAPQGQSAPFVIVGFQSNTDVTVIGAVRIVTRPLVCVKAITQENGYKNADLIAGRCDALLMGSRGVVGSLNVACCGREAMYRTYEFDQGLRWNYVGGNYRFFIS